MSGRLVARTVPRRRLDRRTVRRMLSLMRVCYDNVRPRRFLRDLAEKESVLLLERRPGRELVGFSTVRIAAERHRGRRIDVVFSGDTVLLPEHWGSKVLQRAFARRMLLHKLRRPGRPVYWLLLSAGYKTYLILANHLPRSYPLRRGETDAELGPLTAALAGRWFGAAYDGARGIVRFGPDHYHVRRGVVPLDRRTAERPDVAFFLERNPGHAEGDELVCVGELRLGDLVRGWWEARRRPAGRRAPAAQSAWESGLR